jgi:hypothetical protein
MLGFNERAFFSGREQNTRPNHKERVHRFANTSIHQLAAQAEAYATKMHIPESAHLWSLFVAGHGLHVLKRASLSAKSRLSGTKTRREWLRTNALALGIRLFVNAAAFSYWIAHPGAATHLFGSAGLPMNFTLEPGHATAAMFGLSGDSLMDWAAAKIPALQKEIPPIE